MAGPFYPYSYLDYLFCSEIVEIPIYCWNPVVYGGLVVMISSSCFETCASLMIGMGYFAWENALSADLW